MGCLERPVWTDYTKEELQQLTITLPSDEIRKKVQRKWDGIAKPLDGMGRFETLTAQIGSIMGTDSIDISRKAIIIMCADNGVVEEGISQSGQEVTAAVAQEMAAGKSSVCKMAAVALADTIVVDIGINKKEPIPGILDRKVAYGTKNFLKEPAMTETEAVRAIAAGIELAASCKENGYQLLATGEMGIGNTTTSSAVAAALLNCDVELVTGRGAGLDDKGLLRKQNVIRKALDQYELYDADAFRVLTSVGGLDIAGLVGVCMGGALFHVPVVLDGVISMVAALVAERLLPGTKEYLLPSHKGKEPAVELLMKELKVHPVIDARLALGEGTGAVMMFSLLEMALSVYGEGITFSDIHVQQYQRLS